MKYAIVQVSKLYVCITPAETGKPFVSCGNDRGNKKPDSEVLFKAPRVSFHPDIMRGLARSYARDLAEIVKSAMRDAGIDTKDVILCAEGDQVISQEYQHNPAKDKYLKVFAENEARALVSDDISNYSLINVEYGSGYAKPDETVQLGANVYIMPKSYIDELKAAFREESLNIYKLVPPTVSLVKMAQTGINSFDKSVALISIDFCSVRLLVMQNGVPVYVHSFPVPMGDLVNLFANDQNCTLEEAFEVIRKYGVGISDKCNSVQAGREMKMVFENISNEIVRNLRMVLLSQRIELDQVYISDFCAYIPGMLKHVRTLIQADEINLISDAFTSLTNVPLVSKETVEAGYKDACFYTYSYLVNSGAQNENNLAVYSGGKSSKGGIDPSSISMGLVNIIVAVVAVIALGVMAVIGIQYYALLVRQQNDTANLNDVKYDEIKELLATQEDLVDKMAYVEEDKAALPSPNAEVGEIIDEVFVQFTDYEHVLLVSNYSINSDQNSIELKFTVDDLDFYNQLQTQVAADSFFSIAVPFSASRSTMEVEVTDEDSEEEEEESSESTDEDTEEEEAEETEEDDEPEMKTIDVWEASVTLYAEGRPVEEEEEEEYESISQGTNFDEMLSEMEE